MAAFVAESNRIERIERPPTVEEVDAHLEFLDMEEVSLVGVCRLAKVCAGEKGVLRARPGVNVFIQTLDGGSYYPPPGGAGLQADLEELLRAINAGELAPWPAHVKYEELHPFLDGNGRTGRAIWLWMMQRNERLGVAWRLGFLHAAYYQALQHTRADIEAGEAIK